MRTKDQAFTYLTGIPFLIIVSLGLAATVWADEATTTTPPPPSIATLQSTYGKLPLSFEANQGQWDASVQFVTRGRGHTLFLTPSEAVLSVRNREAKAEGPGDHATPSMPLSSPPANSHSVVRMQFSGADPQAQMVGLEQLPGIVNYFIGDDPLKWRTHIPTYQKVGYKDLYPGIDLVYYGNQGHLEYDLVVAPGADPNQIMLAFDGAEQLTVDEQGDLILTLPPSSTEIAAEAATLRLNKPVVYQKDEQGAKQLLAGAYVLKAATAHQKAVALHVHETQYVAFQVASYDTSKPLIIDPVLSWATYLGGSGLDGASGIAVDAAGHAYVTGITWSSDFPGTASSHIQSTYGVGRDIFVTKLNAAGTAIVYSTYLGGRGDDDRGDGIAVDAAGNAYVTGETNSSDFPVTAGSLRGTLGDGADAFVTKLNPEGTALLYSTYLGGDSVDSGKGIAVDAAGNAYVTGYAGPDFPGTANSPIQRTPIGRDAFVTKLNAAGTAIVYSTYLGGNSGDVGDGIAVDAAGNAYVTGSTFSSDFPGTAGSPIQSAFGGGVGNRDAFVTKLNAAGTAIVYSTYLGGRGEDNGRRIAVDAEGNAYVTGEAQSPNFPGTAKSPIQSTYGGGTDAFVTKLNEAGTAILYSTYLGGNTHDVGLGIAVDIAGNAYVTGETMSPNFPGTAGSPIQSRWGGNNDAFVTKLNPTGTAIVYSTYLGGSGLDSGGGIAVDQAGNVYVAGGTRSSGFPGTAASLIQNANGGDLDAFVAKITSSIILNDLVTFEPQASSYRTTADPIGCPSGFVGKFSFDARLTNKNSSPPLSDLAVQVKTLSNGNLLQNADRGNGGVGSTVTVPKQSGYADGTLTPGESVEVHFSICLKAKKPFTFLVDMLGMH